MAAKLQLNNFKNIIKHIKSYLKKDSIVPAPVKDLTKLLPDDKKIPELRKELIEEAKKVGMHDLINMKYNTGLNKLIRQRKEIDNKGMAGLIRRQRGMR